MQRVVFIAVCAAIGVFAQSSYPPPFPRDGAKKIFENERVAIWDVTWIKGRRTPMHRHSAPIVGVILEPGAVRSILPDKTSRLNPSGKVGQALYAEADVTHAEEGVSAAPARAILVELKNAPSPPPLPEDAARAPAFSSLGATKVLENDRIIAWDFRFDPKRPVPMHHHDKDAIVVTVAQGSVRSTPPDGAPEITQLEVGAVRFRPRNRSHSEQALTGEPRTIVIELK